MNEIIQREILFPQGHTSITLSLVTQYFFDPANCNYNILILLALKELFVSLVEADSFQVESGHTCDYVRMRGSLANGLVILIG